MLPETISSIDGSKAVWEATRTARWFYFLMLSVSAICCLIVATTSDARLILDGPTIPWRSLGNLLPINAFYLIAPIALLTIFRAIPVFATARLGQHGGACPRFFRMDKTVEREGPAVLAEAERSVAKKSSLIFWPRTPASRHCGLRRRCRWRTDLRASASCLSPPARLASSRRACATAFLCEREVGKIADLPRQTPLREIAQAAVVGAGNHGGGIAMCLRQRRYPGHAAGG